MQIKIKDDLLLQQVGDEMVLLEPVSGNYYTLNEVGAVIVGQVQQAQPTSAIVAHLTEEFDVSEHLAAQDVSSLMAELVAQGLAEKA